MPKVSASVVLERERRAWALSVAGRPQEYIVEQLGITQQAVSKILKRVSTRALKELDQAVAQRKAVHDTRLEHIYGEAIGAWDESKKPRKKSRSKKLVVGLNPKQLADMPDGSRAVLRARRRGREGGTRTPATHRPGAGAARRVCSFARDARTDERVVLGGSRVLPRFERQLPEYKTQFEDFKGWLRERGGVVEERQDEDTIWVSWTGGPTGQEARAYLLGSSGALTRDRERAKQAAVAAADPQ